MRIGTWNLDGQWSQRHQFLMTEQNCNVWLLTEVSENVALKGYGISPTKGTMGRGQHWAAVLGLGRLDSRSEPHPASALARIGDMWFCSSILPWRTCGKQLPWVGNTQGEKTEAAVGKLLKTLPKGKLVWGGDWNHSLQGRDYVGSKEGRISIQGATEERGLIVPTATLGHRKPGQSAIDHIAVPNAVTVVEAIQVDASGLSDHDAYVVEIG